MTFDSVTVSKAFVIIILLNTVKPLKSELCKSEQVFEENLKLKNTSIVNKNG